MPSPRKTIPRTTRELFTSDNFPVFNDFSANHLHKRPILCTTHEKKEMTPIRKTKNTGNTPSTAKKRLAKSQVYPSLRSLSKTPCPQTLPPRVMKQRIRRCDRIEVYWDNRGSFFRGTVVGQQDGGYIIRYDDGTEFLHNLNNYTWRFVVLDDEGTETISGSQDLNFEPEDFQFSVKRNTDAVKVERGRRHTGQPSSNAVESGWFLPIQVCKRLTKKHVRLMKSCRQLS